MRCVRERHLLLRHNKESGILSTSARPPCGGRHCKHGWPQALLLDPLSSGIVNDLSRLTCPLLVEAIDHYEREGGMDEFNARLAEDESSRTELREINQAYRRLREDLVRGREEELGIAQAKMGPHGFRGAMTAGVAKMTVEKTSDVKCLHAHVGDELTRGGNEIGRRVLETLEAKGVETQGSALCGDYCNIAIPVADARWKFHGGKNHVKKRRSIQKRQIK